MKRTMTLIALVTAVSGCGSDNSSRGSASDDSTTDNTSIIVAATSYPVFVMASEIGGDTCEVVYLPEETTAPHTWKPSAENIGVLQTADLILLSGAGNEPWTLKVSLPRSRTVDTTAAYHPKLQRVEDSITHQHGPAGDDTGGDTVWATWLDPRLASLQLKTVEEALAKVVPGQRAAFAARSQAIMDRLAKLDEQFELLTAATAQRGLVVACVGSDFEYLTARLGSPIRRLPGDVDAKSLRQALADYEADEAKSQTRILLHDSSLKPSLAESATDDGFQPVKIDLCDRPSAELNLWQRLQGNVLRLKSALKSD